MRRQSLDGTQILLIIAVIVVGALLIAAADDLKKQSNVRYPRDWGYQRIVNQQERTYHEGISETEEEERSYEYYRDLCNSRCYSTSAEPLH